MPAYQALLFPDPRPLWFALHPDPGISGLPAGWFQGKMPDPLPPFAQALLEADLERVTNTFTHA